MDLMTAEQLEAMVKKESLFAPSDEASDIILGLRCCNQTVEPVEKYKRIVTLAMQVRSYMESGKGKRKKWPAILLENLQNYVSSQMAENQQTVPKLIHFVWIGGPIPQVVMQYIKVWAKINPDYVITIWYDSNLLGLKKLSDLLKTTVGGDELRKTDRKVWADAVFRIRQDFTDYVLKHNPEFQKMSETMKAFSVSLGKEEDFGTEPVWEEDISSSNINLLDIHGELAPDEEMYRIYMLEAIQTQNFAALSDMVRLFVLKRFGGVYLDTDMLPEIEPSLMTGFREVEESTRQRLFLQAIMEATGEIPGYSTEFLESYGRKAEIRDIVAGKALVTLMAPLGDIQCNPMGFRIFYRNKSVINQMLACCRNSMAVDMLLALIKQNYGMMDKYFEKPPFLGRSLDNVIDVRVDAVREITNRELQEMLRRVCTYYATGIVPEVKCTIDLTGPTIYACIMYGILFLENDFYKGIFGWSYQYQGYKSFFIPSDKLTYETEEEMKSSWQAEK